MRKYIAVVLLLLVSVLAGRADGAALVKIKASNDWKLNRARSLKAVLVKVDDPEAFKGLKGFLLLNAAGPYPWDIDLYAVDHDGHVFCSERHGEEYSYLVGKGKHAKGVVLLEESTSWDRAKSQLSVLKKDLRDREVAFEDLPPAATLNREQFLDDELGKCETKVDWKELPARFSEYVRPAAEMPPVSTAPALMSEEVQPPGKREVPEKRGAPAESSPESVKVPSSAVQKAPVQSDEATKAVLERIGSLGDQIASLKSEIGKSSAQGRTERTGPVTRLVSTYIGDVRANFAAYRHGYVLLYLCIPILLALVSAGVVYVLSLVYSIKVRPSINTLRNISKNVLDMPSALNEMARKINALPDDTCRRMESSSGAKTRESLKAVLSSLDVLAAMLHRIVSRINAHSQRIGNPYAEKLADETMQSSDCPRLSNLKGIAGLSLKSENLRNAAQSLKASWTGSTAQGMGWNALSQALEGAASLGTDIEECRIVFERDFTREVEALFRCFDDISGELRRKREEYTILYKERSSIAKDREGLKSKLLTFMKGSLDRGGFWDGEGAEDVTSLNERFTAYINASHGTRELNQRLAAFRDYLNKYSGKESEWYICCGLRGILTYLRERSCFLEKEDRGDTTRVLEGNFRSHYSKIFRACLLLETYWPESDPEVLRELSHTRSTIAYVLGLHGIEPHSLELLGTIDQVPEHITPDSRSPVDEHLRASAHVRGMVLPVADERSTYIDVRVWGYNLDGEPEQKSELKVKGPGEGW